MTRRFQSRSLLRESPSLENTRRNITKTPFELARHPEAKDFKGYFGSQNGLSSVRHTFKLILRTMHDLYN